MQLFCSIALDPIDWIAIGFVVFLLGGLLLAFFLYFRTAFKEGGWKNVRRYAWIALGALAIFEAPATSGIFCKGAASFFPAQFVGRNRRYVFVGGRICFNISVRELPSAIRRIFARNPSKCW
jgi:hypothetical protein